MRTFTHQGEEWMVEPVSSGSRAGHTRVRFVAKATRLEAFGHVAAPASALDGIPESELSRSLVAALADQSLG